MPHHLTNQTLDQLDMDYPLEPSSTQIDIILLYWQLRHNDIGGRIMYQSVDDTLLDSYTPSVTHLFQEDILEYSQFYAAIWIYNSFF